MASPDREQEKSAAKICNNSPMAYTDAFAGFSLFCDFAHSMNTDPALNGRQRALLDCVACDGFATIEDLAEQFQVTQQTIRRDVNWLSDPEPAAALSRRRKRADEFREHRVRRASAHVPR